MRRIRAVIGLCVVCALAIGAVGAPGATAAIKGTTGFTCKPATVGGAGFSDAHCKTAVASGAKFEHVAIPENVKTEGRVTNEKTASETTASTPAKLLTVIAGVVVELNANKTEGLATGINTKNGSGEHVIEGFGATTYSEVTVTKPAGKGCKVAGGKITTKELRGISTGMEGKLEPAVGTEFMTVSIEGCTIAALNNNYPITGTVQCPNSGATIICTHAGTTTLGTLKFGGQKAGVEVATTATARAGSSQEYTPVSATTIEE
jgi:hypothetical protein